MDTAIKIEVPKTADPRGCARLHEILDSLEVHGKDQDLIVKSIYNETLGSDGIVGTVHLNWDKNLQRGLMWMTFFEDGRAQLLTGDGPQIRCDGWKHGLNRTREIIVQILANHGAHGHDDARKFEMTTYV